MLITLTKRSKARWRSIQASRLAWRRRLANAERTSVSTRNIKNPRHAASLWVAQIPHRLAGSQAAFRQNSALRVVATCAGGHTHRRQNDHSRLTMFGNGLRPSPRRLDHFAEAIFSVLHR